jgi:hypothetical protein
MLVSLRRPCPQGGSEVSLVLIVNTRRVPVPTPSKPMKWVSSERLADGWIPVDIDSRMSVIRWVQADSWNSSDPFFEYWVTSLRTKAPISREVEILLSRLGQAVSHLPSTAPSGFIFHVSRCGSTLVSNALAIAKDTFVLREAPPIDRAMECVRSSSRYWSQSGVECLRDLITAFACCLGVPPRRVVIKTGFCGIACLRAVRTFWPSVPCLILIRDPLPVVVSNVARPIKLWGEWHADPNLCPFGVPPRDIFNAGFHELCAWTIGRMFEEVLEVIDQHCLVLDYNELSPDTVFRVGSRFGLEICDDRRRCFDDVFAQDAKHPEKRFSSDDETKRSSATRPTVEAVERWALLPYRRLLALGSPARSVAGKS